LLRELFERCCVLTLLEIAGVAMLELQVFFFLVSESELGSQLHFS